MLLEDCLVKTKQLNGLKSLEMAQISIDLLGVKEISSLKSHFLFLIISDFREAIMSARSDYLYCSPCDQRFDIVLKLSRCENCGNRLEVKRDDPPAASTPPTLLQQALEMQNTSNSPMDLLISRLFAEGGDGQLMEAMQQFAQGTAPSRTIGSEIIDSIGVIKVDKGGNILRDVCLSYGAMSILCIPASFCWLPETEETWTAPLQWTDPAYAEEAPSEVCASMLRGSFAVCLRGKVTFANKAITLSSSQPKAIIVLQPDDYKFPFQATDSAGEMPVDSKVSLFTVKENELRLMEQLIIMTASSDKCVSLTIGDKCNECLICREVFVEGDEALRLPCRHLYHKPCLLQWLERKASCPLCRADLQQPQREERHERRAAVIDAMVS